MSRLVTQRDVKGMGGTALLATLHPLLRSTAIVGNSLNVFLETAFSVAMQGQVAELTTFTQMAASPRVPGPDDSQRMLVKVAWSAADGVRAHRASGQAGAQRRPHRPPVRCCGAPAPRCVQPRPHKVLFWIGCQLLDLAVPIVPLRKHGTAVMVCRKHGTAVMVC